MKVTDGSTPVLCGGTRVAGKARQFSPDGLSVSVIIGVLNGAAYLENAIQSVRHQSYRDVELIVIEGGSSDGTVEILRRHSDFIDYWISEADGGLYEAWNKGVKLAKGDWIAFLGADDCYEPDAIAKYVDFILSTGKEFDYVSSRVRFRYPDNSLRIYGSAWNWKIFRKYMNVTHFGSLHHRRLFQRFGEFDVSYRIAGDYEFLLRAGDKLQAGFLDTVTAEARVGGISNSVRTIKETLRAKTTTGCRSPLAARMEYWWARIKFAMRRMLEA